MPVPLRRDSICIVLLYLLAAGSVSVWMRLQVSASLKHHYLVIVKTCA